MILKHKKQQRDPRAEKKAHKDTSALLAWDAAFNAPGCVRVAMLFLSVTKIKLANIINIISKLIIKLAKEVNDLAKEVNDLLIICTLF